MRRILVLLASHQLFGRCSCETIYGAAPSRHFQTRQNDGEFWESRCDQHPFLHTIDNQAECISGLNAFISGGGAYRVRQDDGQKWSCNNCNPVRSFGLEWKCANCPFLPPDTALTPPVPRGTHNSVSEWVSLSTGGSYREEIRPPGCSVHFGDGINVYFNVDVESWRFHWKTASSNGQNLCKIQAPSCAATGAFNAAPCICGGKYLCPLGGSTCRAGGRCEWSHTRPSPTPVGLNQNPERLGFTPFRSI